MTRIALVTNANEYAGPGAVAGLIGEGFSVLAHDRRFDERDARTQFEQANPGAIALPQQDPAQLAQVALDANGRVDALISNDVVHLDRKPLDQTDVQEYRQAIEEGMIWPYTLARALIGQMKERRAGAMVFVTSGAVVSPAANVALYSAARAGTTAMAIALSKELAQFNIQVNAIGPNWFKSETYFPEDRMPETQARMDKVLPLRRLGRQDEMGALIALLASQKAMPMTGQLIAFAGAYY